MPEDHNHGRAEFRDCELDAPDLGRPGDVPGHPDDEKIAESLVEDDLRRHPRIGTPENHRERPLPASRPDAGRGKIRPARALSLHVAAVALHQSLEGLIRSHRLFCHHR